MGSQKQATREHKETATDSIPQQTPIEKKEEKFKKSESNPKQLIGAEKEIKL